MDAVVQFIRNALCCVKDLEILEGTMLWDATYTGQLVGRMPEPMDKTTPLELLISVTQLYACLSCTKSGVSLLTSSVGKLRRIVRLVETRMTVKPEDWTHADRIINESLLKEAKFALRSVFIGILVAPIGIAFWWLFLNSFHITEVDWFGGLPALIHALTIMEICLVPLLYYMVKDGFEMMKKSEKMKALVDEIGNGSVRAASISVEAYEGMAGWTPFWDGGVSIFSAPAKNENEEMEKEITKVKETLATWFADEKKGEKEDKIRAAALEDAQEKLEAIVPVSRMEGYRELLYFFLNFVAFYGYLMGIVAYYYDDDEVQPTHIRSLKFGYSNNDADWHGNFAGDFMWTIEPVVILASPFVFNMVKPQKKKVKSD